MASPFFPMTTTRPSLTPPSIGGGGFSTSPPTGSLLPAGFAAGQQPLSASGTNGSLFGGLIRPVQHTEAEQQQLMPMSGLPAAAPTTPSTPSTTTTTTTAAAAATTSAASADDTQVMSKLQQLMNQMGTFMKSVDARLTTLEKMTGQLMSNQAEQAKSMELRFQEIAQLVQQKSSIIQLQPPAAQQPSTPTMTAYGGGYPAAAQQQPPPTTTTTTTTTGSPSADYELARQLQEQFDQEAYRQQQQQKQQQPVAAQRPGQPLYAPMGGPPMPGMGIPMQPNLATLQMQQMQPQRPAEAKPDPRQPSTCPICSVTKPLGEMEEHVNQHFDESEGVVADALDRSKAKESRGFWDRLFGAEEDPSPSLQVPAQQTGPTYPTQPMMYPTAGAPPGQYAGWPPAAYPQTYSYRR